MGSCHGWSGLMRFFSLGEWLRQKSVGGQKATIFGLDFCHESGSGCCAAEPRDKVSPSCPPCCETHWCPGAWNHDMEHSWPNCVCPYPISQLLQPYVWREKVCVCLSTSWKLKIMARLLAASRPVLNCFGQSDGRSPILRSVESSVCYWAELTLHLHREVPNESV